jgi:hypothetical protein
LPSFKQVQIILQKRKKDGRVSLPYSKIYYEVKGGVGLKTNKSIDRKE